MHFEYFSLPLSFRELMREITYMKNYDQTERMSHVDLRLKENRRAVYFLLFCLLTKELFAVAGDHLASFVNVL